MRGGIGPSVTDKTLHAWHGINDAFYTKKVRTKVNNLTNFGFSPIFPWEFLRDYLYRARWSQSLFMVAHISSANRAVYWLGDQS